MSDFPYDTANVPAGGEKGQVLMKESSRSYDVGWHDLSSFIKGEIENELKSLHGEPNQVLGFNENGELVALDITSGGSVMPSVVTDPEFNEFLSDVFTS